MKRIQFLTFTLLLVSTFFLSTRVATAKPKATLEGHTDNVWSVAFRPNGVMLASASWDQTIRLWNVNTGRLLHTLRGHTDTVDSVTFSPDGNTLVSAGWDGTIRLWNPNNGKLKRTLTGHKGGVGSVAFSPDGRTLASGSADQTVRLWNTTTWKLKSTLTGHTHVVDAVAFSPDGAMLASGSRDKTIRLWNPRNGKHIKTLTGHTSDIVRLMFSPDGETLASGGLDKTVRLWNPNNGKLKKTLITDGWVNPVAFSPDSATLLIGGHGISVWDTQTGQYKVPLDRDTEEILSVVFSRDGQMVASGSTDHKVRLWDFTRYVSNVPFVDDPFDITNIPEPAPPPAAVRDFFQLDPFYQQWINVKGFPVIASTKVSPYALKEAAWVIGQMIGHRPDILKAMAQNKIRLSVIAYNEIVCDIPEHKVSIDPDFCFFFEVRARATFCPICLTVTANEENLLLYQGGSRPTFSVLIHEFAHGLHGAGLNTIDSEFDNQLRTTYNEAMEKGLWAGTYAASNMSEYWAEGTGIWFHAHDDYPVTTRAALKKYDPGLANLLAKAFDDRDWRYEPLTARMHLPHLQGFNPQSSPKFERDPESVKTYEEVLKDPSNDGGGRWVNLKMYPPSRLPRLKQPTIDDESNETDFFLVNLTGEEVSLYIVDADGTEHFVYRNAVGDINEFTARVGTIWLIKDHTDKNLSVFQTEEKTGRVIIGSPVYKITGPWLWMIAPTKAGQGGANSINVDSLAEASNGAVTETDVATNGAKEGDSVGDLVWTLGEIADTGDNNVNDLINEIGFAKGDVNDHSSYALIMLESITAQTDVEMRVGSDDSIKVWLNGEVVHNNPINRDANDFQDAFQVNLVAGDNLLLVKVSERESGWSMFSGIEADVNAVYKPTSDAIVPVNVADINEDGNVNATDLLLVVTALSKDATPHPRSDVNENGAVNVADLLLVIENLDDPVNAAAPTSKEIATSLDPAMLEGQLNILYVESDGSRKYQQAIAFLQRLLAATRPNKTQLLANYPNPFNPETWIPYQLSEPAAVRVHIYVIDGRLIRRLALGHQPAGMYQGKSRAAYWDGRNAVGEPVASGVYFYTLTAGNFTATRKMLIRK